MNDATFRTFSRSTFDLREPDWRKIQLTDIAHGLARINRWNGQHEREISVAHHSLVVADQVAPEWRLAALLHDAHEYALGDLTRPVQRALDAELGGAFKPAWERLTRRLDFEIALKTLTLNCKADPETLRAQALDLADLMRSTPVALADESVLVSEDRWEPADHALFTKGRQMPSAEVVDHLWFNRVFDEAALYCRRLA